jgi:hypothetical protein
VTSPTPHALPSPPKGPDAPWAGHRPSDGEADPELLALPAPRRRGRAATLALLGSTLAASCLGSWALRGEVSYSLGHSQPIEVGTLVSFVPSAEHANEYVRATGGLGAASSVRFGRAGETDTFRLAPVAGNPSVWVEFRIPAGLDGPRFVPPTSFAGRLVPLREAGPRHLGLASAVARELGTAVPPDAWLLVDGATPTASRWALALCALLVLFGGWAALGLRRLLARPT